MPNLPDEFLQRMQTELGTEFPDFIQGLSEPAPISLRLNPRKRIQQFDSAAKIPWCDEGRYLDQRPSFTFDPLFQAGCYYVQEASSMYLEKIITQLNLSAGIRALDLCAAPGGKSTHLLSLLPHGSFLVSNEVIPSRNKILEHNLLKCGMPSVITQNKSSDFSRLPDYFDLVLVDAPCSGEGLFRRDESAIHEWSPENVNHCSVRQQQILRDAVRCLKPGGYLIYSTCTFETSENEAQISNLVSSSEMELIPLEAASQEIVSTAEGLRFYPHRVKGEGLFYSLLRKKEGVINDSRKFRLDEKSHGKRDRLLLQDYLVNHEEFIPHCEGDRLFAIPVQLREAFQFFRSSLYLRNAGLLMGTWKKDDFLPSQDLAMSVYARPELPGKEFDRDAAIRYLRCEPVDPAGLKAGWNLVRYSGFNLGWIKVLSNRSNNYFPKEWRIVSEEKVV